MHEVLKSIFFNVEADAIIDILEDMMAVGDSREYDTLLSALNEPAGLTLLVLTSNKDNNDYRELVVEGDTVKRILERIIAFYKHKTIRRCLRDLYFIIGLTVFNDEGTEAYVEMADINGDIYKPYKN